MSISLFIMENITLHNMPPPDILNKLNQNETKYAQSITGMSLYYNRDIDGTMIPTLNCIVTAQVSPTIATQ